MPVQGVNGFVEVTNQPTNQPPVLHRPQNNVISPIFAQIHDWNPLYLFFSCTTFRRSSTTSATLLIPKCTTRRWNLRLEAPLPVFFSCTTFRYSATTSATLWIPKCTTRRWTLRCSNYSVAKRQQFSYALCTATLSLKFENVVPEGSI